MKAICYCCDEEFELTENFVSIEIVSDHPFVGIEITVECPQCQEQERNSVTLDDFLQERGIE